MLVTLLCGCVNVLTVVCDLMSLSIACLTFFKQVSFCALQRNSVWSSHVVARPVFDLEIAWFLAEAHLHFPVARMHPKTASVF